MALINCPDCGTEVSDAAPACPKCGRPIALGTPQTHAEDRGERNRSPATFTITLSSFVLIALAIAAAVWFVPSLEIGQNLVTSCQVNGTGQGSCQFTNTGWTPGTQCVDVTLRNNQEGSTVTTGPVCSGRVWPNDTTEKNIVIVLGHTCDGPLLEIPDLSKVCTMDVRNVDPGDAGAESPGSNAASPQARDAAGGDPESGAGNAGDVSPSPTATLAVVSPDTSVVPPQPSSGAMFDVASSAVAPTSQSDVTNASEPSFDCAKVTDATDLTICSNDELSQLDRQMAALYFARAHSADDTTARDEQRTWLHDRNQCGADVICLRKEYAARIQQLQQ